MSKTLSATEVRKQMTTLVREVGNGGEPVIVNLRGEPADVIMSLSDYQELERWRTEHLAGSPRAETAAQERHEL